MIPWLPALLLAPSLAPQTERPHFVVLAVGVAAYVEQATGFPPLHGADDARRFVKALKTNFGVDDTHDSITVLDQPGTTTRAAIWAALQKFAAEAKPSDVVVFYYSGHGTQIPDKSKASGRSQAIVPIDVVREGGKGGVIKPSSVISGPNFREIWSQLKGYPNVNLFYDSCHSAQITRGLLQAKSGLPNAAFGRPNALESLYASTSPPGLPAQDQQESTLDLPTGLVGLYATTADSSAWELGASGGLFTQELVAVFGERAKVGGPVSFQSVFDEVRSRVRARAEQQAVTQIPQREGNLSRALFQTSFVRVPSSFVANLVGNVVTIQAGQMLGIRKNYIFGLYADESSLSKAPFAFGRVIDTTDDQSTLQIVDENGKPMAVNRADFDGNERAVVVDGLPDGKLKLYVDGDSQKLGALLKSVASRGFVEFVERAEECDLRITPPAAPAPSTVVAGERNPSAWYASTVGGVAVIQTTDPQDFAHQLDVEIDRRNKQSTLLQIAPTEPCGFRLEVEFVPVTTKGPKQKEKVVKLGSVGSADLTIHAEPNRNSTDALYSQRYAVRMRAYKLDEFLPIRAVHIAMINVSTRGDIVQQFPWFGAGTPMLPISSSSDKTWWYVSGKDDFVSADKLSEIVPFDVNDEPTGVEYMKVLATEALEDFKVFETSPTDPALLARGAAKGEAKGSLGRLLHAIAPGTTRQAVARGSGGTSWTACTARVFVTPRPN